MLQFSPDGASFEQSQSFQSELLELVINIIYMLSDEEDNNTHLSSQGRITIHALYEYLNSVHKCVYFFYFNFPDSSSERPEGRMVTLMENVVLFSQTLLLKLYIGTYLADCEILLNFLADQIVVVRQMHIHKHACNGMWMFPLKSVHIKLTKLAKLLYKLLIWRQFYNQWEL